MRTSIITSILALAASTVTAQYYNETSAPFYLVLNSRNKTLDGKTLYACHEGAAIEGLCLGGLLSNTSDTYNFNTSSYSSDLGGGLGKPGLLVWELHGGNFNLSSPMQISSSPMTNVAVPLFMPSDSGTEVGFDETDKLYVLGGLDDTVVPPVYNQKAYYRWQVCQTQYGYYYTTLAWVVGPHSPENPTCEKVSVKRVFV